MIKFAIPKGSIEEATYRFIEQAWFSLHGKGRSYRVRVGDPEIQMKILRPQEIPTFVSNGLYDIGITGKDWVTETSADVKIMLDLEYGWVRLVYAIPKGNNYNTLAEMLRDYAGKNRTLRVSTEYLNIASRYIMSNEEYRRLYGDDEPMVITPWWRNGGNSRVQIILSFGATEAKPPEDSDAIIDITETGTTLEQNNLKPIESIMESTAVLFLWPLAILPRRVPNSTLDR
ncbi:MAG: ATP phosphoribosyltransferase [Candidatus Nitrosocaldus sp.]